MATTVTGKITAALSANWSKDLDIGSVAATPQASASLAFTNGEGANKVEAVAVKAGTVAGSGSANIDLAGTLTDPGGDVITFDKIKAFLVKNTSESGSGFEVGGSFDSWVKASGDEVKVMPGGFLAVGNPTARCVQFARRGIGCMGTRSRRESCRWKRRHHRRCRYRNRHFPPGILQAGRRYIRLDRRECQWCLRPGHR